MALSFVRLPALSALPGLVHGFEQRPRSKGAEAREAARARARAALDGTGRLLLMRQVHGATVIHAPWEGTPEADAAWASAPGLMLGLETADCLPVLLADPIRHAVAAVHAGWRGTAAGVAARTVEEIGGGGSRAADLVVAVGPGIGPCCYEVGEEVRAAFGQEGQALFRPGPRGRPHLDLRAATVRQLLAAGVRPERIHHLEDCTFCRDDLYPSYRRDGSDAGRIISFVGYASSSPRPSP